MTHFAYMLHQRLRDSTIKQQSERSKLEQAQLERDIIEGKAKNTATAMKVDGRLPAH